VALPRSAVLWAVLLVGAGSGGVYIADRLVLAPGREMERRLAERDEQIRVLRERTQALEAAVRLLRHTERRARIAVLEQSRGADGHLVSRIRFSELDPGGETIGEPREFVVTGDEVYVDALVIKFEDEFVTAGDALKGRSLLLFRRIFGDRARPVEAHVLDREGQMPQAYGPQRVRARAVGAVLDAGQRPGRGQAPGRARAARRGGVHPAAPGRTLRGDLPLHGRADDPADPLRQLVPGVGEGGPLGQGSPEGLGRGGPVTGQASSSRASILPPVGPQPRKSWSISTQDCWSGMGHHPRG
jgi:hypothetical protein